MNSHYYTAVYKPIKRLSACKFVLCSEKYRTRSERKFGLKRTERFERSLEPWSLAHSLTQTVAIAWVVYGETPISYRWVWVHGTVQVQLWNGNACRRILNLTSTGCRWQQRQARREGGQWEHVPLRNCNEEIIFWTVWNFWRSIKFSA